GGGGPHVHAPGAGVGVGHAEAVDGVGEAALLADLVEQTRGHSSAEDVVEDLERPTALVGPVDPLAADDYVRLLGVTLDQAHVGPGRDRGGVVVGSLASPLDEDVIDEVHYLYVVT